MSFTRCHGLVFVVASLLLVGCGDKTTTVPPPTTPATAKVTMESELHDPARVESHETPAESNAIAVPAITAANTEQPSPRDPSALAANKTSPDTNKQSAVKQDVIAKEPELAAIPPPTPEQLAAWKFPSKNKLKLLRCVDSDQLTFATKLAASPDGRSAFVGGVKLVSWPIDADHPEHTFVDFSNDEKRFISALAVSPDGALLIAGDSEGWVYIWNIKDRKEIARERVFQNDVVSLTVSPDQSRLAVLSHGKEIKVCQLGDLKSVKSFDVSSPGLKRIQYLSANQILCASQALELWNSDSGSLEKTISQDRYQFTMSLVPGKSAFAYATKDGLQFANVSDQTPLALLPIQGLSDALLSFQAKGSGLACSSGRGFQVYDQGFAQPLQIEEGYGSTIVGLSWLPETNLLVTVNEIGRLRVWGAIEEGKPLNLSPLHEQVAVSKPASSIQAIEVLDLRTLPLMPDCVAQLSDASQISYVGRFSADEATAFYNYWLSKQGWSRVANAMPIPGQSTYEKDGFTANVMTSAEPDQTRVMISYSSNVDLRNLGLIKSLPAAPSYANAAIVMCDIEGTLLEWEVKVLKQMHADGWTAYARLNSSHKELPDQRMLQFVKDGTLVLIDLSSKADQEGKWLLRITKFSSPHSIPVPADAGFVEFDGSTQPLLVANTSLRPEAAREFYDEAMRSQGWLVRQRGRVENEGRVWGSYSYGERDVMIGFLPKPDGKTLVVTGKDVTRSSWQLRPAEENKPRDANAGSAGIEAADFPKANEQAKIEYDAEGKTITITQSFEDLIAIGAAYQALLEKQNWKPTREGIKSSDYVFLTFGQGKQEINLRARKQEANAIIQFEGSGIVWSKPLPVAPQRISYEAWLRQHRYPTGLDLLPKYEDEMQKIAIIR